MYDIVIIGGGPGGYASALYAHNFGLKVALVEKDRVGGTCLLRGCIPAKAWIESAGVFSTVAGAAEFGVATSEPTFVWPDALARKQKVVEGLVKGLTATLESRDAEIIEGHGRIVAPGRVEVEASDGSKSTLETRTIILATGSAPSSIPGYEIDGDRIVSSDHALDWTEQPKSVAVIGGGVIGCEFASFLGEVGTEVHVFEMLDQLVPGMEPEASKVLARAFRKKKIKTHLGIAVGPPTINDASVTVPFGDESVDVDVVLMAVGRRPVTDDAGLDAVGLVTERGFLQVDTSTMATAATGVYAVGDIVAGTPQLAHVAFAEAITAVTHIATGEAHAVDYNAIPMVVYTHPEVGWVGQTEAMAIAAGIDVEIAEHGMRGVGRAIIQGTIDGTVKVVAEKDGPIVGATVVGHGAGEMVHELMYAVGWEALPEEAASFIHAHPTISEAIGETLMSSAGRSLH